MTEASDGYVLLPLSFVLALIGIKLIDLILVALITGIVYPLAMTVVAQTVFPSQANGSLIEKDGKVIGSRLIGQPFDDPKYFWGRPSATSPFPYNAGASSGSNQGRRTPRSRKPCRSAWMRSAPPIPATRRRGRWTS